MIEYIIYHKVTAKNEDAAMDIFYTNCAHKSSTKLKNIVTITENGDKLIDINKTIIPQWFTKEQFEEFLDNNEFEMIGTKKETDEMFNNFIHWVNNSALPGRVADDIFNSWKMFIVEYNTKNFTIQNFIDKLNEIEDKNRNVSILDNGIMFSPLNKINLIIPPKKDASIKITFN